MRWRHFSSRIRGPRYFGLGVPACVVRLWARDSHKQVIAQAELAPVLLSRLTFPSLFSQAHVICFVDNDSARFGLIKGYSPNMSSARILSDIWLAESKDQSFSWFERVPSPSNIADGPSRLTFSEIAAFKDALCVNAVLPDWWCDNDSTTGDMMDHTIPKSKRMRPH